MAKNANFHRAARGQQGFTLMEMLVVLVIVGILMGVAASGYGTLRDKARMTNATATAKGLSEAWTLYLQANGRYPKLSGLAKEGNWYLTDAKFIDWKRSSNPPFHYDISYEEEGRLSKEGGRGFVDPWGRFFRFQLDSGLQDGTGIKGILTHPDGSTPLTTTVLVWSYGRDGQKGRAGKWPNMEKGEAPADDIVVW